jgi:outer membrane protein assembly factor BamB
VGGWDGNVYCIDASTGANVWTYTTQGHVSSSPAVSGGCVYVGSWDHNVYALGLPQASTPAKGLEIWTLAIILIIVLAIISAVVLVFFRQKATKNTKT